MMVKVAPVVAVLPHSSVAVKVTVALPVLPPQVGVSAVKSCDHVTLPQASEATAPAWLASQLFKSAVLPAPLQVTLKLEAGVEIAGGVVS